MIFDVKISPFGNLWWRKEGRGAEGGEGGAAGEGGAEGDGGVGGVEVAEDLVGALGPALPVAGLRRDELRRSAGEGLVEDGQHLCFLGRKRTGNGVEEWESGDYL